MTEEERAEWTRLVSATMPSAWAEDHLRLKLGAGEVAVPFRLAGREFIADVMDDLARDVVLMKGAQVAGTSAALGRIFWMLDEDRADVLFVLPRIQDVSDFSAGRFNATKDASPRLASLFSGVDNVTHKVTRGGANLYLRGAQTPPALKSIPVSLVVLDEFDEMTPTAVSLARERTSGQTERWILALSTPTLPGVGIDREFSSTDRRRWHVTCPLCRMAGPLKWPDSLGGDLMGDPAAVTWRCRFCASPWSEEQKRRSVSAGWWEAENPGAAVHGYHLPQLLSPVRTAGDHAERWRRAQFEVEEYLNFFRSVLAEPSVPAGMRVDDQMVADAYAAGPKESAQARQANEPISIGVDVGVNHHFVEVSSWGALGEKRVLCARVVRNFGEVFDLVSRFRPGVVVVDANPNTEAARAFQGRCGDHGFRVWLAFYATGMLEPIRWHPEKGTVSLNRTEILDRVVSRFVARTVAVPKDVPGEYMAHHRALQRLVERSESRGNEEARYQSSGADHFAHAAAYCEAAGTGATADVLPGQWPEDHPEIPGRPARALVNEHGWPQDSPSFGVVP